MEALDAVGRSLTERHLTGDLDLSGHTVELSRYVQGGVAYVTLVVDGEALPYVEDMGAGRKTG